MAEQCLNLPADGAVHVLVVDNGSTDRTAAVAEERGVTVLEEPERHIGRVRNAGARAAGGDILIFLDADTRVPASLLCRIGEVMSDATCIGGAVDTVYRADRAAVRRYLAWWRTIGLLTGMAQGACQFCTRDAFFELGGYSEVFYMGEDVEFYWRLRSLARRRRLRTCFIDDVQVMPSARRFDRWPLWRTLVWTNPIVIMAVRRRRAAWAGWYRDAPR